MSGTMKIHFEGFWQCRLSTDPDPTLEGRGVSGYTNALPGEGDFDRVIRTQLDQIPLAERREPFPPYLETLPDGSARQFGVRVTEVEGAPTPVVDALKGANLRLMQNPRFELRNQIVGDGINRIAPPIVPFDVQIESPDGAAFLRRSDPLDPSHPQSEIWQLRPADFAQRVPVTYRHLSDEVVETIFPNSGGAANSDSTFIAYFNQRKQLLSHWLTKTPAPQALEAAGYRARIRAIDHFAAPSGSSDPALIENRLGLQCVWDHAIRGKDALVCHALAPYVDVDQDWRTRFWMGGWDGDLLIGWVQGYLKVPLR